MLREDSESCYAHYQEMLNEDEQGNILNPERDGLARELARMNLTLNYYTEWYWKVDLHNFMNFLRLRADPHAQYEIRVYADAMIEVLKKWCPIAAEAFEEYRIGGHNLSKKGLAAVKQMIAGKKLDETTSGLTKREWAELAAALELS